jgi:hypothetical protein
MILDVVLPDFKVPPHERPAMSETAYLDWLGEQRRDLIRSNDLQRLRVDPVRCPVNVRFVWKTG